MSPLPPTDVICLCFALHCLDLPRAIWRSHTDSIVLFTDAIATEHTPKAIIRKTNSRNIIVRCNRLEAIFLQKMFWFYSIERQGVLFQLVFLLIGPQTAPTTGQLHFGLITSVVLSLPVLFCFHLFIYHPSFLLYLFFLRSFLFFHICLLFCLLYFFLSFPSVSSSLLVIYAFLFPLFRLTRLPYSLSFILSFIWILSHLLKQDPQSNVAMVTKKQLTGGGNVILLSVRGNCEPTLCLSENNITVYFTQQDMIHCNGKQI